MYDIESVKAIAGTLCDEAEKYLDLLAELDGKSGDGDLGETVGKLSTTIKTCIAEENGTDISMFLKKTAMAMNKAAPSTLGTLLSGGVLGLAKYCKGKETLSEEDIIAFPGIFADAIRDRGKAELGDKTILDALYPMADAVKGEYEASGSIDEAFAKGAAAAEEGANSTAGMVAKAGRARWIAERTQDNLDAGAVFCAKTIGAFKK